MARIRITSGFLLALSLAGAIALAGFAATTGSDAAVTRASVSNPVAYDVIWHAPAV
ncbi:hypothetical protein ACFXDJ_00340 [Streptomyces sp. NPDC059443]|uniref:hypothetical protein n=1 Tax=unclassified Streptomyces TaxID=2593676 RepID=UPI003674D4D5